MRRLKLESAEHMGDEGLHLNLGKADANTDPWPSAEGDKGVLVAFVFLAWRREPVRVEPHRIGKDVR